MSKTIGVGAKLMVLIGWYAKRRNVQDHGSHIQKKGIVVKIRGQSEGSKHFEQKHIKRGVISEQRVSVLCRLPPYPSAQAKQYSDSAIGFD